MADWAQILLWLLAGGAAFVVAAWAHLAFWNPRLDDSDQLPYDELHTLSGHDGAPYELRRLSPASASGRPPLLMIHGIAFNHRNVDANPQRSLPRWLRERGYDVWLLTLRSGLPECGRDPRVTFSSMIEQDVPLAVAEVLRRTGAHRLDCLGFSMGGMLLYAWLSRPASRESVRRVIIMGSPAIVRSPIPALNLLRGWPLRWVPPVLTRRVAQLVAFLADHTKTPFHRLPYNPYNVRDSRVAGMLVGGVQDIPASLHRDFVRWAWSDQQITVDGEVVLDGLVDVNKPVLFVAGADDRLASLRAVRVAYDAWDSDHPGSADKRFLELSVAAGASADYGHGDMILGDRAPEEVYEPIAAFLGAEEASGGVHADAG